MRIHLWMVPCMFLGLLAPAASAKQHSSHTVGKHAKPNHPMSKARKAKRQRVVKNRH